MPPRPALDSFQVKHGRARRQRRVLVIAAPARHGRIARNGAARAQLVESARTQMGELARQLDHSRAFFLRGLLFRHASQLRRVDLEQPHAIIDELAALPPQFDSAGVIEAINLLGIARIASRRAIVQWRQPVVLQLEVRRHARYWR